MAKKIMKKKIFRTLYKGRMVRVNAVFAWVKRGATKAKPFLAPALVAGKKALTKLLPAAIQLGQKTGTLPKTLNQAVMKAGYAALAVAKKRCPVATGTLRNSLNVRMTSPYMATIGTAVKYAPFVEHGTKGGTIIRPVRKKALAFYWPRLGPAKK